MHIMSPSILTAIKDYRTSGYMAFFNTLKRKKQNEIAKCMKMNAKLVARPHAFLYIFRAHGLDILQLWARAIHFCHQRVQLNLIAMQLLQLRTKLLIMFTNLFPKFRKSYEASCVLRLLRGCTINFYPRQPQTGNKLSK